MRDTVYKVWILFFLITGCISCKRDAKREDAGDEKEIKVKVKVKVKGKGTPDGAGYLRKMLIVKSTVKE